MRIGILGAGQLGRMLAQAAHPLGHEIRFLDPGEKISAEGLGDHCRAAYDDEEALRHFAQHLDAITYEFENVPVTAARFLEVLVPVYPPPMALEKAQDRWAEKTFAAKQGLTLPNFFPIRDQSELKIACDRLSRPFVMKTNRLGYDGKGQSVIRGDFPDALASWDDMNRVDCVAEEFVDFSRELSLLAVRSTKGDIACYPLVENHHRDGILRLSLAPAANVSAELQRTAEVMATAILEKLNYVGTLAIEFFERGGELLFNEMAPRVHNSGHWSIEGAVTSQFANHIRAVTGEALGSTEVNGASAMINVIGDWPEKEWIDDQPDMVIHDYQKSPRPGRKIGHVSVMAPDMESLIQRLKEAHQNIQAFELEGFLDGSS